MYMRQIWETSNEKELNGLFRILDNHLIRVFKKHNITIIDIVAVAVDVGIDVGGVSASY